MLGWCNGSAGFVFLWTLAGHVLDSAEYLTLAELAAWDAWEANGQSPTLCCGAAGQAYAFLNLYKQTGDTMWLARARAVGAKAASAMVHANGEALPWKLRSLYRGEVGIAVLAADLDRPDESAMPLFENEGWPEPVRAWSA
jgi:serine/threonine-protein kinase